jgi:glycosyltransferase involved in cell wall biosynthesis
LSDDASSDERYAEIEGAVAGDERFVISRSQRRRGFYLNFERALRLAPREAEFIALCDQDDFWYPDKLTALRAAIGDAPLAYSDARLTDGDGAVVAHSLWPDRRPNTEKLTSVLVANSLAGASALIRADVARRALPFPRVPGWAFHDRWLPAVALSAGPFARVDRPLYDYVQHEGAVLRGRFGAGPVPPESRAELTPSRARRWRGRYFYGYLPLRMYALALLERDAASGAGERRALTRLAAESPGTALRLSLRSLRPLLGRNETSGLEWVAASGLLWRSSARLRTRLGRCCDTAPPPVNLWDLAPPRWAGWRPRR